MKQYKTQFSDFTICISENEDSKVKKSTKKLRTTEIHFDFGVEAATVKADQSNWNIFAAFLTSSKNTKKVLFS